MKGMDRIMKRKHIMEFKSGNTFSIEFNTKKESDKALQNALHNNFSSVINRITVCSVSHPEIRETIDLTKQEE